MLSVENVTFRYTRQGPDVLRGVNLELGQGEIGILLGRNGSGKTTLFQNILGILNPRSGVIRFEGEDLRRLSRAQRAKRIAYVPQDIRFGALSVFDSVLMGRVSSFGLKAGREDYLAVERILRDMHLECYAQRNVEELSGGERQKIAVARAMAQEPRFMVFDEPTGNLDMANEQQIIREARRLARQNHIGILSSIHDLNRALEFGDRFFFLKDGVVKYAGGKECFREDVLRDIFDIDVKIRQVDGQMVMLHKLEDNYEKMDRDGADSGAEPEPVGLWRKA